MAGLSWDLWIYGLDLWIPKIVDIWMEDFWVGHVFIHGLDLWIYVLA